MVSISTVHKLSSRAGIWTRGRWVRSTNTTSVLCSPLLLVPSTLEGSCDRSCCCFRGFRKSAASDFLPQSNKTGAVHFVRMASVRKGCRALTSWFLLSLYYSMVSWNNGIVPGPFQYPGLQTVELTFYHLSGIAGIKVKILKHGPFPAYFSLFWSFLLYN